MLPMDAIEQYVRLCGEIGHFTESLTGTSIVDAYFGPEELAPKNQQSDSEAEILVNKMGSLVDQIRDEVDSELRSIYLVGELEALRILVRWLAGESVSYSDLVEGMFHISADGFSSSDIKKATAVADEAFADYPGDDLRERIIRFQKLGGIKGDELKQVVEGDLQDLVSEVGQMFKENVFSLLGTDVTDKGVECQAVTNEPWSGYNYYLGGFKSVNAINTDYPLNQRSLLFLTYHEYEHHVSNLFREKAYLERGFTDLAIIPTHTGRSLISEGTAETAREFLDQVVVNRELHARRSLAMLGRMVTINAAIMLNQEGKTVEETVEYMMEYGFREKTRAQAAIPFIGRTSENGKTNLWAPYIFTYLFGRIDFVFPTFTKAVKEDVLGEFFKTIYLDPYSCSSVTWKKAFEWL
ncbi:MAG: hypothetical protein RTU09_01640 [Candidatus Thorarchaeota archaeon]